MFETFSWIGERVFPERQLVVRSAGKAHEIAIPGSVQAATALALIVAVGTIGIAGVQAAKTEGKMAASVQALTTALAQAQAKADSAQQQLQLLAATGQESGKQDDAASDPAALAQQVAGRIQTLEQSLQAADAQQQALQADREKLASETGKLTTKVGELEKDKQKFSKADKTVATERDELRAKVAELQGKLQHGGKLIITQQPAGSGQAETADGAGSKFDVDTLMNKLGVGMKHKGGEGGPYVALGSGKPADAATDPEAQALLKTLPLSAPLDQFTFESGFGARVDPFNGHRSMHTGLDLSAPYKSPVYSTSPGTVVFAGWSTGYGKMVEIDHGHGIHTRYAHLNRLMVNVGQAVGKHVEIGQLGSTGRSTGPHVHYEVLVNGVAQDPARFFDVGRTLGVSNAAAD